MNEATMVRVYGSSGDSARMHSEDGQQPTSSFQGGVSNGGVFLVEVASIATLDAYGGQRYTLKVLNPQTKADTGHRITGAVVAEDGNETLAIGERLSVALTSASFTPILQAGRSLTGRGTGFPVSAFSWLNHNDAAGY